ncbi:hypothetical protein L207DRAFT_431724 [Hyaloscypha variabilis F]|uniref:Uncharacterized protein n=1 Tax=Hyaloscypha variabilis (strain UAMH 11265 / GT02V1 / F) TaxID=1149755 RepID=A0A2J6RIR9_HYAVF|nr:hypothetical protein L207DRAFT_431724 [Hyaloscypha variabilis F]
MEGKVIKDEQIFTYKDYSNETKFDPIEDNFPLGNSIQSRKDFPKIPSWNRPPATHVKEKTPLFIGFTRSWPLLQQVVLSYITAGWPPEDIYVVENTGTFHSNKKGLLSLQNPFFLNHTRLDLFGVNVLITPTLLTFSQLQTYYLFTALEKGWDYFFWSHMDVIITTDERSNGSFYSRVVDGLRETQTKEYLGNSTDWAIRFYAYDWLALNHVQAFLDIGGWDTFISYYTADCDMHERFKMANVKLGDAEAGYVSDVGTSIDLSLLFRKKISPLSPPKTAAELDALEEDERGGDGYSKLAEAISVVVEEKKSPEHIRNSWQGQQTGGQGDPFYREPHGFAENLERVVQCGIESYERKWGGHKGCGLPGFKLEDIWMLEKVEVPEPLPPPEEEEEEEPPMEKVVDE